jgi:hypothetical protein
MVRFHPGSLTSIWSVGAEAARRRGKAEDWVQFPDGPLTEDMDGSSNGKMPRLHRGDRGSIPRPVHWNANGLMVQRDDTALAWRKSEFDSRWVH